MRILKYLQNYKQQILKMYSENTIIQFFFSILDFQRSKECIDLHWMSAYFKSEYTILGKRFT